MKTNGRAFKRIPAIVHEVGVRYQVNPKLIAAVIYQGSKGNAYTVRYDPTVYSKRIASRSDTQLKGTFSRVSTRDTERHGRATYWGLMQVLGQTAREEFAFDGDYLTELLDPEANIDIGVQLLKRKLEAGASLEEGLAAYGGSKTYADQVIAYMEGLDIDFLLT